MIKGSLSADNRNNMFDLCQACTNETVPNGYMVQQPTQPPKFYQKFTDIKEEELHNSTVSIVKVSKSDITLEKGAVKGDKAKFIDKTFPPEAMAMGEFQGLSGEKWRRVSDLVKNPILFPKEIRPHKTVATNYKNNIAYQAALAALAESPYNLTAIFGDQTYTPSGAYNFYFKRKGVIQEVVVDDYVPIKDENTPSFTTAEEGAVWAMILEKARAKLHGSYENMIKVTTTPKQVWQEITFAPSDQLKHSSCDQKDVWNRILAGAQKHGVMCGLTCDSEIVNWPTVNLTASHYYTILDAGVLNHKLGSTFQVIKLRNAFKNEEYKGQGSYYDTLFWDQLVQGETKKRMTAGDKEGVIYMLFSDYLKYFGETFINHLEATRNYLDQPLKFLSDKAILFDVTIFKEAVYSFSIDQDNMKPPQGIQYQEEGWSRTSLVIAKYSSSKDTLPTYEYIDGILKYNEEQATLRTALIPGKYLLQIKLDPTISNKNFPEAATLTAFSS